jgi:hypothetical protein
MIMKSRLTQVLLAAVLCSSIGCTKELSNESGNANKQVNGDFYATIEGVQWNADSLQLILVDSNGQTTISGLSKTGGLISMVLPAFKTGTYPLSAQSISYAGYESLFDTANVYLSNVGNAAGTITISAIDTVNHLVSGSFSFTLVNPVNATSKTITAGVLAFVPYSVNTGTGGSVPPPGGNTDTLEATINGTNFFAAQVESADSIGQLLIAGINSDQSQALALYMPDNITAGSYSMDFATGKYIGVYNPSASVTLLSQTNGTLTIISNNATTRRISGTFVFMGSELPPGTLTAQVSQGYFAVSY